MPNTSLPSVHTKAESGNDPSRVADEFGYTGFDIRNVVTVAVTTGLLPLRDSARADCWWRRSSR